MFSQIDYGIFQRINHFAEIYPGWNPIMRFLAQDIEYAFYLGVVIYWFMRAGHNRRMVAEAILSACIGVCVSGVLGHLFYRDRPFVAHTVIQLIQHPANASFPSDHAVGAFVIATAIWIFRRKDGLIWLAIAACIAFSRIWVGVHYPSDVIAGALLGIGSTVLVHQMFSRSKHAHRILNSGIGYYENIELRLLRKVKRSS